MTRHIAALSAGLTLLLLAPTVQADTETSQTAQFDAQMQPLYGEYRKIHEALAGDAIKGVAQAAKHIARLAGKLDPSTIRGQHAAHYKGLPRAIKAAAEKLVRAREIAAARGHILRAPLRSPGRLRRSARGHILRAPLRSPGRLRRSARKAFQELSRPFAMWATMSRPDGINVVFCSMARGSWLQSEKVIANPYYGARMLRCGEVVSGKDKGAVGGHMKTKHGQMH